MRATVWIIALVGLFVRSAWAETKNELPKEVRGALDKTSDLEVYSLDPVTPEKPNSGFHGWKVLCKTAVKEAETRQKLLAALYKGVAENQDKAYKCFQPRL